MIFLAGRIVATWARWKR